MIITDSKNFIENEFTGLDLGDERLNKRAKSMASAINSLPNLSLPAISGGNDGQLKAMYRFCQNPKVNYHKMMRPHYLNTLARMDAYPGNILVANDSTFITPTKSFIGLMTRGKGKDNCVRAHYALAVSEDGHHIFGILDFQVISDPLSESQPDLKDESEIWLKTASNCLNLIRASKDPQKLLSRLIFIGDREADEYELMKFLSENNFKYIIRCQYDRNLSKEGKTGKREDFLDQIRKHGASYKIMAQVEKKRREAHVQRSVLRTLSVIPPVKHRGDKNLIQSLVLVDELDQEQSPIAWKLWTNLEVNNPEQSEFVVTTYTHRWKIEEVNKAAKTGVGVEERQFTELDHFLPFLAMAFVIAWRIVAVRTIAEHSPETKISEAFTPDEEYYLKAIGKKQGKKMETVDQALEHISRLGGFTGRYARAGWQILWTGWMRFSERVEGVALTRETMAL